MQCSSVNIVLHNNPNVGAQMYKHRIAFVGQRLFADEHCTAPPKFYLKTFMSTGLMISGGNGTFFLCSARFFWDTEKLNENCARAGQKIFWVVQTQSIIHYHGHLGIYLWLDPLYSVQCTVYLQKLLSQKGYLKTLRKYEFPLLDMRSLDIVFMSFSR